MMAKKKENFLDYVPRHSKLFPWTENEKKHVEIIIKNKGIINKLAQTFFKKPKYSNIELDDLGSFIWKQIDGKKNVHEIGKLVKNEFGEDAEPLYNRLVTFVGILHRNKFIVYENKIKKHDK